VTAGRRHRSGGDFIGFLLALLQLKMGLSLRSAIEQAIIYSSTKGSGPILCLVIGALLIGSFYGVGAVASLLYLRLFWRHSFTIDLFNCASGRTVWSVLGPAALLV